MPNYATRFQEVKSTELNRTRVMMGIWQDWQRKGFRGRGLYAVLTTPPGGSGWGPWDA